MVQNLKRKEQIKVPWDQQKTLRFHQNRGALQMGKGRTPGDSMVSTRDNRHQVHRTTASVGMTSVVNRACQTLEGADPGVHLWLWVPAVSTKSLSRVLTASWTTALLHCNQQPLLEPTSSLGITLGQRTAVCGWATRVTIHSLRPSKGCSSPPTPVEHKLHSGNNEGIT